MFQSCAFAGLCLVSFAACDPTGYAESHRHRHSHHSQVLSGSCGRAEFPWEWAARPGRNADIGRPGRIDCLLKLSDDLPAYCAKRKVHRESTTLTALILGMSAPCSHARSAHGAHRRTDAEAMFAEPRASHVQTLERFKARAHMATQATCQDRHARVAPSRAMRIRAAVCPLCVSGHAGERKIPGLREIAFLRRRVRELRIAQHRPDHRLD